MLSSLIGHRLLAWIGLWIAFFQCAPLVTRWKECDERKLHPVLCLCNRHTDTMAKMSVEGLLLLCLLPLNLLIDNRPMIIRAITTEPSWPAIRTHRPCQRYGLGTRWWNRNRCLSLRCRSYTDVLSKWKPCVAPIN